MGKKRTRSKTTSKGERRSISKEVCKLVRRERSETEKSMNKLRAWREGKNPWITVAGDTSRERFKRVRANSLWGDPKKVGLHPNIYRGKTDE